MLGVRWLEQNYNTDQPPCLSCVILMRASLPVHQKQRRHHLFKLDNFHVARNQIFQCHTVKHSQVSGSGSVQD